MTRGPAVILIICVLALIAAYAIGANPWGREIRLSDGDSGWVKWRLANVDTPEIDGKCQKERELAKQATDFTAAFLKASELRFEFAGWDRYGRALVFVSSDDGKDLGSALAEAGLAHIWQGSREASGSWCQ